MPTINLDGQDRKLDLTFDALFEAEKYPEEFGAGEFDVGEFMNDFQKNHMKVQYIKRMLWLYLYHNSPDLTPRSVEEMLRKSDMNIVDIAAKLSEATQMGTPEVEPDEKKKIITKVKSKLPKGT